MKERKRGKQHQDAISAGKRGKRRRAHSLPKLNTYSAQARRQLVWVREVKSKEVQAREFLSFLQTRMHKYREDLGLPRQPENPAWYYTARAYCHNKY